MQTIGSKLPLREHLRAGTKAVHDRLDRCAATLELLEPAGYARFLAGQLAARDGIEEWADRHCPALLRPPSTTALLRDDLAELPDVADLAASPPGVVPGAFALPARADPLGLAWALAGSQLGNRAMLAHIRKAAPGPVSLPLRFLADTRMTAFWHRLLPRLQEPVSAAAAEPALAAANAVFARFELAFTRNEARSRQAA